MEPLVLLDTNVVLARCLDPAMDAKGRLADEVFRVLSDVGLRPYITESVRRELRLRYKRVWAKSRMRLGDCPGNRFFWDRIRPNPVSR